MNYITSRLLTVCLLFFCSGVAAKASARTGELRFVDDGLSFGKKQYSLSFCSEYATATDFVMGYNGEQTIKRNTNQSVSHTRSHLFTGITRLRYGVTDRWDVAIQFPFFGDITGWDAYAWGTDDIALYARYAPVALSDSSLVAIAGKLGVTVPSGNARDHYFPRDIWYLYNSEELLGKTRHRLLYSKVFVVPSLSATFNLQRAGARLPVKIHCNTGVVLTDSKENTTIEFGVAVSGVVKKMARLSIEIESQTRPFIIGRSIFDAIAADPVRIVPSLTVILPRGFDLQMAIQAGFANGKEHLRNNFYEHGYLYSTKTVPFYGASMKITCNGIWPTNMNKGRSSRIRGNSTDFDLDSVPDSTDACKKTPEDRDGFEDGDGCPEYDNDKDGVVDESDGCPDNPEDKDGFEDKDGCPDYDNDKDGVPDSIDACRDVKGLEMYRGCAEEELVSFTRKVLQNVEFEAGTSKIIAGTVTLDKIYMAISRNPKIAIEIQVHTDNQGSALECSELSQNRADMIKLYLVSKGVRPDKIKALGLGSEFPIADNSTEEGRAKNVRVEVRRTD